MADIASVMVSRRLNGAMSVELASIDADTRLREGGNGILISVFRPNQFLIIKVKSTVAQSMHNTSKLLCAVVKSCADFSSR